MIGLKPQELLDLTYRQYLACLRGYERSSKDQQALAVITGYYSVYFRGKHAKSLKTILREIYSPEKHKQKHVDTVDVQQFLEREQKFNARMAEWQRIKNKK